MNHTTLGALRRRRHLRGVGLLGLHRKTVGRPQLPPAPALRSPRRPHHRPRHAPEVTTAIAIERGVVDYFWVETFVVAMTELFLLLC